MNLGLKISYICNDCDEVEAAIGTNPQTTIDAAALDLIHTNTASSVEGNTISNSGSLTFKLQDLGLTKSTIETTDLIFSVRRNGESSYSYSRIVAAQALTEVECGEINVSKVLNSNEQLLNDQGELS